MNQRREDSCYALIAHDEAAKSLQPRVRPLNDPAALVPSKFTPVLMRGSAVISVRSDDRFDVPLDQQSSYLVAVVAAICNQALWPVASGAVASDASIFKCSFQQFHFRGGSLLHGYSERRTRAISQYHVFCSLARAGDKSFLSRAHCQLMLVKRLLPASLPGET